MTYDLLDSTTLASSASSVTFSSISQDYRDLVLVADGTTTTDRQPALTFNGLESSIYSSVDMGATSGPFSSSTSDTRFRISTSGSAWSTQKTSTIIQIMDYTATDKHKSVLIRSNNVTNGVYAMAGRCATTAAIHTLRFETSSFEAGTTFHLYGIAG